MSVHEVFHQLGRFVAYATIVAVFASWVCAQRDGSWQSRAVRRWLAVTLFLIALGMLSRLLATPLDQQPAADIAVQAAALAVLLFFGALAAAVAQRLQTRTRIHTTHLTRRYN